MSRTCEEASIDRLFPLKKKHLHTGARIGNEASGVAGRNKIATLVHLWDRSQRENENVPVRNEFYAVAANRGEKGASPVSSVLF